MTLTFPPPAFPPTAALSSVILMSTFGAIHDGAAVADGMAACADTNGVARDSSGNGCNYYQYPISSCGYYDTGEFTAQNMCCTCGGGTSRVCAEAGTKRYGYGPPCFKIARPTHGLQECHLIITCTRSTPHAYG